MSEGWRPARSEQQGSTHTHVSRFCPSLLLFLPPSWQYLGPISLQYPTASFRAVWRDRIPADTPVIGIGLSIEPLQTIANMPTADAAEEEKTLDSAKGIAKNLYEFMASYSQNTGSAAAPETGAMGRSVARNSHVTRGMIASVLQAIQEPG